MTIDHEPKSLEIKRFPHQSHETEVPVIIDEGLNAQSRLKIGTKLYVKPELRHQLAPDNRKTLPLYYEVVGFSYDSSDTFDQSNEDIQNKYRRIGTRGLCIYARAVGETKLDYSRSIRENLGEGGVYKLANFGEGPEDLGDFLSLDAPGNVQNEIEATSRYTLVCLETDDPTVRILLEVFQGAERLSQNENISKQEVEALVHKLEAITNVQSGQHNRDAWERVFEATLKAFELQGKTFDAIGIDNQAIQLLRDGRRNLAGFNTREVQSVIEIMLSELE